MLRAEAVCHMVAETVIPDAIPMTVKGWQAVGLDNEHQKVAEVVRQMVTERGEVGYFSDSDWEADGVEMWVLVSREWRRWHLW